MAEVGLRGRWRLDAAGWAVVADLAGVDGRLPAPAVTVDDDQRAAALQRLTDVGAVDDARLDPRLADALTVILDAPITVTALVRGSGVAIAAQWGVTTELAAGHVLRGHDRGIEVEVRLGAVDELVTDVATTIELDLGPPAPGAADAPRTLPIAALGSDGVLRDGTAHDAAVLAAGPVVTLAVEGPAGSVRASWMYGPSGPVEVSPDGDQLWVRQWPSDQVQAWLLRAVTGQLHPPEASRG